MSRCLPMTVISTMPEMDRFQTENSLGSLGRYFLYDEYDCVSIFELFVAVRAAFFYVV